MSKASGYRREGHSIKCPHFKGRQLSNTSLYPKELEKIKPGPRLGEGRNMNIRVEINEIDKVKTIIIL